MKCVGLRVGGCFVYDDSLSVDFLFLYLFCAVFPRHLFITHRHTPRLRLVSFILHITFITLLDSAYHAFAICFSRFYFKRIQLCSSLAATTASEWTQHTNANRKKNLRRFVRWFSKCFRITRREDVCVCERVCFIRTHNEFHPSLRWRNMRAMEPAVVAKY